ncbi:MarR family winged helix-turn-helix transcriptional regulator [Paracidovorax valerianellae]|uniref:Transcriptional regulator, MarR family n=1 Tax=Paracidovorax valerianellae TaxID=187868 RepID=A0A1G6I5A0_9BURK|nr:MarR family transcriptional regulator [Paracidovorax valerianellae]MDA8448003.1 MarR family transcriptional regulator [Paracidovorax valerianellae]SDC01553.1 transcriptional regulator, MarR family [Paracidovorax valerianellae]
MKTPAAVETDADCALAQAVANVAAMTGVQVCTNTSVRLAARRLGQLYDEALAPLNLKATQLALIVEIGKFMSADGQGPTLQDLANRLAIQLSALTHALRPLVRDGIVELHQDAQDRRSKHGVLTARGKQLLAEAIGRWAAANERVEAVLGSASAANLRALADQVASDAFLVAYKSEA